MIQELLSNSIYLKNLKLRIPNFSPLEKAEAFGVAQEQFDKHFRIGTPTRDEMLEYLYDLNIWSETLEQEYEKELDKLNDLKVDYYDNYFLTSKKEELSLFIGLKEVKLNKLLAKKLYLSEYTCEMAMDEAYWHSLLGRHGDAFILYRNFLSSRISEEKIRSIYFDQKWRAIWYVSKDPKTIFGCDMNWLNDNQLSLLYWSKMYDNIGESPDAPDQKIMVDSLAVDGWMIKYSRNKDKPKNIGGNAQEVFLPAKTTRDVKEINSLNSQHGKRIIQSRSVDILKHGEVDESDFTFIKQEKQMEINRLSTGKPR